MTLVIPGVEVRIVKEVVTPQLSPSGILGLVGLATGDDPSPPVIRASSWSSLREQYGAACTYALPEAMQALENGVCELVVVRAAPTKAATAALVLKKPAASSGESAASTVTYKKITFTARAHGTWANGITVEAIPRGTATSDPTFDLTIRRDEEPEVSEVHRGLTVGTVIDYFNRSFSLAEVGVADADSSNELTKATFGGGTDPDVAALKNAIGRLCDEPDVDLVAVAVQAMEMAKAKAAKKPDSLTQVYSAIISHCNDMSGRSRGRIGFGQVPSKADRDVATTMRNELVSDRFVLVAPYGVVGAVVGLVGSLSYYESPTFRTLSGVTNLSTTYSTEDQSALLSGGVLPVVSYRGRGIIVLRGITTDLDQISIRRVADRAARGLLTTGEQFIGRLNTVDGRTALKQKLTDFLVQMEKENAIVPSVDGKQPAFQLSVYSSQADFSQGIVRVDMAVRPVRAIDYIYATVLVQN